MNINFKNKKVIFTTVAVALLASGALFAVNSNKGLKDGIYTAYGDSYNFHGYKPFSIVEVKNGRMIDAVLNYVNDKGMLISADRLLKDEIIKETETYPLRYTQELKSEFLLSQGTDNFAKATAHTESSTFKTLLDSLVEERINKGDTDILEVKVI